MEKEDVSQKCTVPGGSMNEHSLNQVEHETLDYHQSMIFTGGTGQDIQWGCEASKGLSCIG